MMKLLQENEAIYYSEYYPKYSQLHIPRKFTCRLYDLYRKPNELLGMDVVGKAPYSIRQLFNNYSNFFKK